MRTHKTDPLQTQPVWLRGHNRCLATKPLFLFSFRPESSLYNATSLIGLTAAMVTFVLDPLPISGGALSGQPLVDLADRISEVEPRVLPFRFAFTCVAHDKT